MYWSIKEADYVLQWPYMYVCECCSGCVFSPTSLRVYGYVKMSLWQLYLQLCLHSKCVHCPHVHICILPVFEMLLNGEFEGIHTTCKRSHYVVGVLVHGSHCELTNRTVHMVVKVYGFSMVKYSSRIWVEQGI